MILLLARHGNTFAPGETATIAGRHEDLPLTAEGEAQAARLARFCLQAEYRPRTLYCGALQRTRRTAEIVAEACAAPVPGADDRLTELDYGAWSGLATAEIRARFGDAEFEAWECDAVMPQGRRWHPSAGAVIEGVQSFAAEARAGGGPVLAVTSNGILRFFAMLVPGLFDELRQQRALKVATGNVCGLEWTGAAFALRFWNRAPE